jgi:hypothetical protein
MSKERIAGFMLGLSAGFAVGFYIHPRASEKDDRKRRGSNGEINRADPPNANLEPEATERFGSASRKANWRAASGNA